MQVLYNSSKIRKMFNIKCASLIIYIYSKIRNNISITAKPLYTVNESMMKLYITSKSFKWHITTLCSCFKVGAAFPLCVISRSANMP